MNSESFFFCPHLIVVSMIQKLKANGRIIPHGLILPLDFNFGIIDTTINVGKEETFRIHRNSISVSLDQEFHTFDFLYLHFYSF